MQFQVFLFSILLASGCTQSDKVVETGEKGMNDLEQEVRTDAWLSQQMKYADKRMAGADIIAFGEDPNWNLSIGSNGDLTFKSETAFGDFNVSNVEGMQPQDLNAMTYGGLNGKGSISVMVFSDSCTSNSGEVFPNRIKISGKKGDGSLETFQGCGLYLNDPALNDIWAVKGWSGQAGVKAIPENAHLEFNMNSQKVYGNFGCGDIDGYFNPMGSKLKLYGMDYTDKSCREDASAMKLFNHLNFKTHTVLRSDLNLKLIADGDTVTFLKVD